MILIQSNMRSTCVALAPSPIPYMMQRGLYIMLQNTVQYGKVSEARLLPDILTSFSLNFPVLMHQGIYFSKYFLPEI